MGLSHPRLDGGKVVMQTEKGRSALGGEYQGTDD